MFLRIATYYGAREGLITTPSKQPVFFVDLLLLMLSDLMGLFVETIVRRTGLVFLFGFCLGCSTSATKPQDAITEDFGMEFSQADRATEEPDTSQNFCSLASGTVGDAIGVLPKPRLVIAVGEEVAILTIRGNGTRSQEEQEIRDIAQEKGLTVSDDAQLVVTMMDESDFDTITKRCGFDVKDVAGAYYLKIESAGQKTVTAYIAGFDAEGKFYALKTLKQLISGKRIRQALVVDYPETPVRGVLEGFYGKPWQEQDRLSILKVFSDLKFNVYAYAPKDDQRTSLLWKIPFTDEDKTFFSKIGAEARRNRLRFCFEIRPVLFLKFSQKEDFDAMIDKVRTLHDCNVDCIILAFDDADKMFYDEDMEVYSSYVEGLADFMNRLGKEVLRLFPDMMLAYGPRDYYLYAPDINTDLAYMGQHLDKIWEVAWTGNEVVSKTISPADVEAFTAIVHRVPILADNFPVVEDPRDSGVVNLAPITGRAKEVPSMIKGFIMNPMPLPYSSLIGIASGADFAWNPDGYDEENSLETAGTLFGDEIGRRGLVTMSRTNRTKPLWDVPAPELAKTIEDFFLAYETASYKTEMAVLRNDFEGLRDLTSVITPEHLLPSLADELAPWASVESEMGDLGLLLLDLLDRLANGDNIETSEIHAVKDRLEAIEKTGLKPTITVMPDFFERSMEHICSSIACE
jgi:hyaluronoglucosaminidase